MAIESSSSSQSFPAWAIVTATMLDTAVRLQSAKDSWASLHEALGDSMPRAFVCHDLPWRRLWGKRLRWPKLSAMFEARKLYQAPDVHLLQGLRPQGSVRALLKTLEKLELADIPLAFIHLDDQVYVPTLLPLVEAAREAFAKCPDLQIVKFVGYPVITGETDPKLGNQSFLEPCHNGWMAGGVHFRPTSLSHATLWSTPVEASHVHTPFWPFGLWLSLFRRDFLSKLLRTPPADQARHLANVEQVLRDEAAVEHFLASLERPAEVGFINFQFAGLEWEKIQNWRALLASPNKPVLA